MFHTLAADARSFSTCAAFIAVMSCPTPTTPTIEPAASRRVVALSSTYQHKAHASGRISHVGQAESDTCRAGGGGCLTSTRAPPLVSIGSS